MCMYTCTLKYCCSHQAALDSRQSAGSASQWRWAEWEQCHTARRRGGGFGNCNSISVAGHSPARPWGSHTNVAVSRALQTKKTKQKQKHSVTELLAQDKVVGTALRALLTSHGRQNRHKPLKTFLKVSSLCFFYKSINISNIFYIF